MKVLHICPDYLHNPLYDKLFLALQSNNVNNAVFAHSHKNTNYPGEKPYSLKGMDRGFNIFDRLIYFRKQYILYKKICKEFTPIDFDIVHAHTLFSAGFSAYLLYKKFGLPYIVAVRNTDVNQFFKYMPHLRGLGRSIMKNAQNIVFLSFSYRDFIANNYFSQENSKMILDKSVVIPNGIDEYFLDNKFALKRKTNSKIFRLIYIGEINSNKNIETTIKACKLLFEKGYTVNFTIVGEILNFKYHKILAKYSYINYHPKCSKQEVVSYLRNSDIFIMPSILESFGLVYAEAMSQGLPIIYSKGQGFDEQFENGVVGYAVNCFDHKAIAQKIIDLYADYQQFSDRCFSLSDKFNWLTIAKEYKKIYRDSD